MVLSLFILLLHIYLYLLCRLHMHYLWLNFCSHYKKMKTLCDIEDEISNWTNWHNFGHKIMSIWYIFQIQLLSAIYQNHFIAMIKLKNYPLGVKQQLHLTKLKSIFVTSTWGKVNPPFKKKIFLVTTCNSLNFYYKCVLRLCY
jgi:hypothetical protein